MVKEQEGFNKYFRKLQIVPEHPSSDPKWGPRLEICTSHWHYVSCDVSENPVKQTVESHAGYFSQKAHSPARHSTPPSTATAVAGEEQAAVTGECLHTTPPPQDLWVAGAHRKGAHLAVRQPRQQDVGHIHLEMVQVAYEPLLQGAPDGDLQGFAILQRLCLSQRLIALKPTDTPGYSTGR